MVAPSLPDRPDGESPVRSATPAPADEEHEAAVTDLAAHWAALASPIHPSRPGLAVRLAALLRRLAAACRDEQFWALRARVLGGELLRSGLCGEWSGPLHPAEDVLPATLGLLRDRLPKVFGLPGCCAQRLATVLDEMAAGYAGALRDRVRREQEEDLRRRVAEAVDAGRADPAAPSRGRGAAPAPRLRLLRRGLPRPVLAGPRRVRLRERHARPRPRRPAAGRGRHPAAPGRRAEPGHPDRGRRVRGARRVRRRPPRRREPGPAHPGGPDPALPGGRAGGGDLGERRRRGGGPGHRRARRPPPGGGRRAVVGEGAGLRAGGGVRPGPRRRRVGPGGAARRDARRRGARRVPAALPAARAPRRRAGARCRGARALAAPRARAARSGPVRRGGGAQRRHRAAGPLDPHRGVPAGRRLVARAGAAGAVRERERLARPARRARLGGTRSRT